MTQLKMKECISGYDEFEPPSLSLDEVTIQRFYESRPLTVFPHCNIELCYVRRGAATYAFGERSYTIRAGQMAVIWGGRPHQVLDLEPLSELYVINIPLKRFVTWLIPEQFVNKLMNSDLVKDGAPECGALDAARFKLWEAEVGQNPGVFELEVRARLTRFAMGQVDQPIVPKSSARFYEHQSKAAKMAIFTAENYTQKINIDSISEHVDLQANYAMALFQKVFHTTMLSFLTQFRVAHAQHLLVTTRQSVTDIAGLAGFQSISRFNTTFLELSQCSPREYRQNALGAGL